MRLVEKIGTVDGFAALASVGWLRLGSYRASRDKVRRWLCAARGSFRCHCHYTFTISGEWLTVYCEGLKVYRGTALLRKVRAWAGSR